MMRHRQHFGLRRAGPRAAVARIAPLPGQVADNAGEARYAGHDAARLARFLLLGSERGITTCASAAAASRTGSNATPRRPRTRISTPCVLPSHRARHIPPAPAADRLPPPPRP